MQLVHNINEIFDIYRTKLLRANGKGNKIGKNTAIRLFFENGATINDHGDNSQLDMIRPLWNDGLVVWGEIDKEGKNSSSTNNNGNQVAADNANIKQFTAPAASAKVTRTVTITTLPPRVPDAILKSKMFPSFEGNILKSCREVVNKSKSYQCEFIESNQGDFVSFDYDDFKESSFSDPFAQELRGLIVHRESGRVMARRFHKFFNFGEGGNKDFDLNMQDSQIPEHALLLEKYDGRLCSPIIFFEDNEVIWASKRQMDKEIQKYVSENWELRDRLENFARLWAKYDFTVIFEFLDPQRPNFIRYPEKKLILLAARHNISGFYCDYDILAKSASEHGIEIAKKLNDKMKSGITFKEAARWISRAFGENAFEGCVLYCPAAQQRIDGLMFYGNLIKMKTNWYISQGINPKKKSSFISRADQAASSSLDIDSDELQKLINDERSSIPYAQYNGSKGLEFAILSALKSSSGKDDIISSLRRRAASFEDKNFFDKLVGRIRASLIQSDDGEDNRIETMASTSNILGSSSFVATPNKKESKIHTIFVDLDGVLADFENGIRKLMINQRFGSEQGEGLTRRKRQALESRNMSLPPTDELWKLVRSSPGFFAYLDPLEGKDELWEYCCFLQDNYGIDIYILSSLPRGNLGVRSADEKVVWCQKNLPNILDSQIITCKTYDKRNYAGEGCVLIDDRPEVYEDDWKERGGIFIAHKDFRETLKLLEETVTPSAAPASVTSSTTSFTFKDISSISGEIIQNNIALSENFDQRLLPNALQKKQNDAAKPDIIILRGLPGSGKSTITRILEEKNKTGKAIAVVSADHFFMKNGEYKFNLDLLEDAHEECFSNFCAYIEKYQHGLAAIVVDNTNTTMKEVHRYTNAVERYGLRYFVIEILPLVSVPEGTDMDLSVVLAQQSIHSVPPISIARMIARWEEFNSPRDLARCSGKIRLVRRIEFAQEALSSQDE